MTDTVATQDDNQAEMLLPENMPGSQLKKARERKQLSTKEVAEKLNLKHSFVLMIESDEYDSLPGATFVRGYLRAYGKLVDIDSESLLEAYNSAFKEEAKPEQRYKPIETIKPQRSFSDPLIKYTTLAVIAALIALSIMWWQSRNGAEPLSLTSSDTVTVETSEGETIVAQMDLTGTDDTALTDEDLAPEDQTAEPQESDTAPADEPVMVDEKTAESEPAPADVEETVALENNENAEPSSAELINMETMNQETFTITFSEECWVEVVDDRGIKVVANLKQPGEESLVEGLPPFKLMIGNAGGAQVTYKGELIDLKPYTNRNNIARFTLGE